MFFCGKGSFLGDVSQHFDILAEGGNNPGSEGAREVVFGNRQRDICTGTSFIKISKCLQISRI